MTARLTLTLAVLSSPAAVGADIVLNRAVVVAPAGISGPPAKAVQMLVEEVETRSLVRWERATAVPTDGTAAVIVGPAVDIQKLLEGQGITLPAAKAGAEGYRVGVAPGKAGPVVYVSGNDARGALFGIGRLLRELRLDRLNVTLPGGFAEASVPQTPLRGHQIGYRPKTNSYDGWTAAMWEQYVRDLAVFGCNAI